MSTLFSLIWFTKKYFGLKRLVIRYGKENEFQLK